jgi:hypothetical protein
VTEINTKQKSNQKEYRKKDFPVEKINRFLEPGPVVLVSSQWKGELNIMTMSWHTVMEYSPSLIGCMITAANHSFNLIKKRVRDQYSREIADICCRHGNTSGADTNNLSSSS